MSLWVSFYFACSYPGIQQRKAAWLLEQMMEKLAYLTPSPAGKKVAFKFTSVRSCWHVAMHRWRGLSWGISLLLNKSRIKLKLVKQFDFQCLFSSSLCLVVLKVILLKLHDQRSSVGRISVKENFSQKDIFREWRATCRCRSSGQFCYVFSSVLQVKLKRLGWAIALVCYSTWCLFSPLEICCFDFFLILKFFFPFAEIWLPLLPYLPAQC